MSTTKKSLLAIIGLILATTAALAAMGAMGSATAPPLAAPTLSGNAPVTVSTEVVQDKVLKGGDGRVTVSLNLTAARLPASDNDPAQAADLVIVLDRSAIPHPAVHRRSIKHRSVEAQQRGREHLVGDARCGLAQNVGGRRGNNQNLTPVGQRQMRIG